MNWSATLVIVSLGLVAGCSSTPPDGTAQGVSCCRPLASVAETSGRSVYELGASWETDGRQTIHLADLQGRPQIVSLFYSSCHVMCPITVERMQHIETALPREVRSRVGFVLITLDPTGDTPAALRVFRREHHLLAPWNLLRGSEGATQKVAARLGVAFEKSQYRLAHGSEIVLLNAEGKIVSRASGLYSSLDPLVEAVKGEASRVGHSPPVVAQERPASAE